MPGMMVHHLTREQGIFVQWGYWGGPDGDDPEEHLYLASDEEDARAKFNRILDRLIGRLVYLSIFARVDGAETTILNFDPFTDDFMGFAA